MPAVAIVSTMAMTASPLVAAEPAESMKEFVLELPADIETARRVVLELSDVKLPKNAAVVFRARAVDENGAEVPLGSVGLLAQSNEAEGTAFHSTLRIDVTKALKRWRLAHPEVSAMRVRVAPFAGAEPLTIVWSTTAASLIALAP
jgi:hypothetical protein